MRAFSIFSIILPVALMTFTEKTIAKSLPGVELDSFQTPSSSFRPRFRYWLPDGSVDPAQVKADIISAASIGAGGVELLPFFNYGGQRGNPPAGVDWAATGFGTPPFRRVFKAALEGHKETGMLMDFPLGPNQAQGVPANRSDEGLQWDLVPFSSRIPSTGQYDQTLPGWGTGNLVAAVTVRVLSSEIRWELSRSWGGEINTTWSYLVLDSRELEDVTSEVFDKTGRVELQLPETNGVEHYRLFAFYEKRSLHKNLNFQSDGQSIWDDGSFVVDHFSARGAQTTIQFWEDHMLTDGIEELLKDVGNYGWEDSMEIHSNISWTPSLAQKFYTKFRYSLHKYLPLLIFRQNNIAVQQTAPGEFHCVLNTLDQGSGFINDFRSVLEEGYNEYLQTLANWTHSRLSLQFSAQPTYNLPMDMAAAIPMVDVPECESLGQSDSIDAYRQFTGPAFLSGKRILSNEMGAASLRAYSYTLSDLLFSINRAFVSGINALVLHGQTYGGRYPQTTWPGYTPFGYLFSEMYSPKQPSWNTTLPGLMDYIARAQWVLQTGVPRVDVAVLRDRNYTDPGWAPIYDGDDLETAGWSYNYISAANLDLPQAYVEDNVLAPETLGWRALIVEGKQRLSAAAIVHLQTYARSGLPIILSGGLPGYYATKDSCSEGRFARELNNLIALGSVHQVEQNNVAKKLFELGLQPRVQPSLGGKWYSFWREDRESQTDFAFLLNDSPNATAGEITVSTTKTPFWLDLWTGEELPVLEYQVEDGNTTVPLTLNGNQAVLLAFGKPQSQSTIVPTCNLIAAPDSLLGYEYSSPSEAVLHLSAGGEARTSSNKAMTIGQGISNASFELTKWNIVMEHWERPEDFYDSGAEAVKYNTTHNISSLTSWLGVPALTNVSGIAHYYSSFEWRATEAHAGAYIQLPSVLHGALMYVNGQQAPMIDPRGGVKNITPFIKEGRNEVLIIVPSTMWNYIRGFIDQAENSGNEPHLLTLRPGGFRPALTDNGLIGEVSVIPFFDAVVNC